MSGPTLDAIARARGRHARSSSPRWRALVLYVRGAAGLLAVAAA